jgi:PAS domain S-box-containing protein
MILLIAEPALVWPVLGISMFGIGLAFCAAHRRRVHGQLEKQIAFAESIKRSLDCSKLRRQAEFQATQDALFIIDSYGLIVEHNEVAEKMFGRQLNVARLRSLEKVVIPESHRVRYKREIRRKFVRAARGLTEAFSELTVARDSEGTFRIEYSVAALKEQGRLLFAVIVREIADHIEISSKLKVSEERWKNAVSALGDGVWEWDFLADHITYSLGAYRVLGYCFGDFGSNLSALLSMINPAQREIFAEQVRLVNCAESERIDLECQFLCKDQTWKWLAIRAVVVERDIPACRPFQIVGTLSDISVRINLETERTAFLLRSEALAKRLRTSNELEMKVGGLIQRSLLVKSNRQQLNGLWLSAFNQASTEVDGDFYDVICPNEFLIDIVCGDVMGKGVNAALMGAAVKMQLSRSILELTTRTGQVHSVPRISEIVASIDAEVGPHLQELDAFVTLCYLRIDTRADQISWIGCGHEEAILFQADGSVKVLANEHPPLGVLDDVEFVEKSTSMLPQDTLFVHSDGVSDALLSTGQRVGLGRLKKALAYQLSKQGTPAAVLHQVRRSIFPEDSKYPDDLTMIVATRISLHTRNKYYELPVKLSAICRVREFISKDAAASGLDPRKTALITLAAVEAFTNIVRHAKALMSGAPIEIVSSQVTGYFQVELIYPGDPYFAPCAGVRQDPLTFPEGGFGLDIIRDACDHVDYLHSIGVNTTQLRMRLECARSDATA